MIGVALGVVSAFGQVNPSPGLMLPSAMPVTAGQVETSAGVGAGLLVGGLVGGVVVGGDVRVGAAPADGLWLSASATAMDAGIATALGTGSESTTGLVSLSAAWAAYRTERFWVGPIATAAVVTDGSLFVPMFGVSAGGTVGRSDQIGLDASLATGPFPSDGLSFLTTLDAGVRFGANAPHQVRVGLLGNVLFADDVVIPLPLPDVTYRFEQPKWYLELGTTGLILLQGVRAEVGLRF